MGSFQHPRAFQPLELEIIDYVYEAAWAQLEIIDYVYEAAWAQLEARDPFRDREHDWVRQAVLRKQVMTSAGTSRVEFDSLYEKVLGTMPEHWATFTALGPQDAGERGGRQSNHKAETVKLMPDRSGRCFQMRPAACLP